MTKESGEGPERLRRSEREGETACPHLRVMKVMRLSPTVIYSCSDCGQIGDTLAAFGR
jgi:hypothetical protein